MEIRLSLKIVECEKVTSRLNPKKNGAFVMNQS